jgi:hypothetical protein
MIARMNWSEARGANRRTERLALAAKGLVERWSDNEARRRRTKLGLRREQDLIAAEPADAGRVGSDLEPFVILVEHAKF